MVPVKQGMPGNLVAAFLAATSVADVLALDSLGTVDVVVLVVFGPLSGGCYHFLAQWMLVHFAAPPLMMVTVCLHRRA